MNFSSLGCEFKLKFEILRNFELTRFYCTSFLSRTVLHGFSCTVIVITLYCMIGPDVLMCGYRQCSYQSSPKQVNSIFRMD
jgi:hypothetical protein